MTNLDRRDMLRRGGAAALFAGLAGILTQSAVVAEAGAALEAAPAAKKPGLTLRLLKEHRVLEARCDELRAQYESLKRATEALSAVLKEDYSRMAAYEEALLWIVGMYDPGRSDEIMLMQTKAQHALDWQP